MSDATYTAVQTDRDIPKETWAEREVRMAIERESIPKGDDSDSWIPYVAACYNSALKVYNVMADEGHSGMSWGVTRNILIRLLNNIPLSPITGNDEEWENCGRWNDGKTHYQNVRRPSLFKTVDKNGKVAYSDNGRSYCYNIDRPDVTYGSAKDKIVDELYPITMPYTPPDKKFKVECDEFLCDKKMGDFDHYAVLAVITPDGERIPVNKFYQEKELGWVRISKDEYYEDRAKRID